MADEQDGAEAVDEEVLADEPYPPDRPQAVDEDQVPDSLATRARREAPLVPDDERRVIQPYEGPDADLVDDEPQAVAEETVDPDRAGDAGAEEAALHEER
jgi:hypothetical protein